MTPVPLTLHTNPIGRPFAEITTTAQATTNDWVELDGSRAFLAGAYVVSFEILALDPAHAHNFRVSGALLPDFSDAEVFSTSGAETTLEQFARRVADGVSMHRYYRIEIRSELPDTPSLVQARIRAY